MLGITVICFLLFLGTACYAQSFAPNIWDVDPGPTNSLNVTGMTFFHSSFNNADPDSSSVDNEANGFNTYTTFLGGQSQNVGPVAPQTIQTIGDGTQKPRLSLPSWDTPSLPVDTPRFGLPHSQPTNRPTNTLLTNPNNRLVSSQSLSAQMEKKKTSLNSQLDLSKFGILENNVAENNGQQLNINGANSQMPTPTTSADKPFPFSQLGGDQKPAKKIPIMKTSGKFVDHSRLPVMRVQSKFVDTSMIKMPDENVGKMGETTTTTTTRVTTPPTIPTTKQTTTTTTRNTWPGAGNNMNTPRMATTTPAYDAPVDRLMVDDLYPKVPFPVNTNNPPKPVDDVLVDTQVASADTAMPPASGVGNSGGSTVIGNKLKGSSFPRNLDEIPNMPFDGIEGSTINSNFPQENGIQNGALIDGNVGTQSGSQPNANLVSTGQNGQVNTNQNIGQISGSNMNNFVQNNPQYTLRQNTTQATGILGAGVQNGPVVTGNEQQGQGAFTNDATSWNQAAVPNQDASRLQNTVGAGNLPVDLGHGFNQQTFGRQSSSGRTVQSVNGQVNRAVTRPGGTNNLQSQTRPVMNNNLGQGDANIPQSFTNNQRPFGNDRQVINNNLPNTQIGISGQQTNIMQTNTNVPQAPNDALVNNGGSSQFWNGQQTSDQKTILNNGLPRVPNGQQINSVPQSSFGNQLIANGQQSNGQRTNSFNSRVNTNILQGNTATGIESVPRQITQFSNQNINMNAQLQGSINGGQISQQGTGNRPQLVPSQRMVTNTQQNRFSGHLNNNVNPQRPFNEQLLNGQSMIGQLTNEQDVFVNGQQMINVQQTALNNPLRNNDAQRVTINGQLVNTAGAILNGQPFVNGPQTIPNANTPQSSLNNRMDQQLPAGQRNMINGQIVNGNTPQIVSNGQPILGQGNVPNGQQPGQIDIGNNNARQILPNGQQLSNSQQSNNGEQTSWNGQPNNDNGPQAVINGRMPNSNSRQSILNGQSGFPGQQLITDGQQLPSDGMPPSSTGQLGRPGNQMSNGQMPSGQQFDGSGLEPISTVQQTLLNGQLSNNGQQLTGNRMSPNTQVPSSSVLNGFIQSDFNTISSNVPPNPSGNIPFSNINPNRIVPSFSNSINGIDPSVMQTNDINGQMFRGNQVNGGQFPPNSPPSNIPQNNGMPQNRFRSLQGNPGMPQTGPNFANMPNGGPVQFGRSQLRNPNIPQNGFTGNRNFLNVPNNNLQDVPRNMLNMAGSRNFFVNRGPGPAFGNRMSPNFPTDPRTMFGGPIGPFK